MQTAKQILDDGFSFVKAMHNRQVQAFFARIRKLLQAFWQYIRKSCQAMLSAVLAPPVSLKDYVKLGDLYFSKRFLARLLIGISLVTGLIWFYAVPQLEGRLWIPVIQLNSAKFHAYTGKAKIVNESGVLIYEGELKKGVISGGGRLYKDGQLIYEGEFADNQYNGKGILYEDGKRKYDGMFSQNLFEGKGTLYFASGRVKYQGEFAGGDYGGSGVLRADNENNSEFYRGSFEGGSFSGNGKLFTNGRLLYAGGFAGGVYAGEGRLYDALTGNVVYIGGFAEGLYSGKGSLYGTNKKLIYDGMFSMGRYEGRGKLYQEITGQLVYDGEFSDGRYNGEGILYSPSGRIVYQGKFFAGLINFAALFGKDVDQLRGIFGQEDELRLREQDFVLLYRHSQVAFVCSFAKNGLKPVFKRAVLFGSQKIDGIACHQGVVGLTERLGSVPAEKGSFMVGENEAYLYNLSGIGITAGSTGWFISYKKEDLFFKIFADRPNGQICYYEVGGI